LRIEEMGVYRGQEGQWAYYLHRLSGLAIVVYLVDHITSVGRAAWGREAYNSLVIGTYAGPVYRIGLTLLVGAVLYHTISGIRVMAIDFWPAGVRYQKPMFYGVWVAFLLIYIPWALHMLRWLWQG
jgi:succinate dehydrogenase / fumarate reductase cytochrome b subunit